MQSECYLGGGYRLPVFAYQVACFYAGRDSMSACQQKSVADGWMKGRNSTPKQRALCQCCLDWLVGEGLAECMPLRSDATLPLHLPCKLPVAGGNLRPGRNQDAVPRIAAYGEDAAVGEHLSQPCNRVIDVSLALTGITSSTSPDAVPRTLVDGEEAAELGAAPGLQRQLSTSSSLESGEIREDLDGSVSDSATESLMKKAKVSMPEYLDRHEASADWAVPRIAADGEDAAVGEHLAECTLLRSDATLPPQPPWVGCLCTAARPTSLRSLVSQVRCEVTGC